MVIEYLASFRLLEWSKVFPSDFSIFRTAWPGFQELENIKNPVFVRKYNSKFCLRFLKLNNFNNYTSKFIKNSSLYYMQIMDKICMISQNINAFFTN